MKVGYFKVAPSVPTRVSPVDRALSLPPDRKLVTSPRSRWKLATLPLTGFVLALMLVGSLQVGVKLANYDLPQERYNSVAKIDLPDNVLFMASVYESVSKFIDSVWAWLQDLWRSLVAAWRAFWGLDLPTTLVIKSSQMSPPAIFGGKVLPDKKVYAVLAMPVNGVNSIDEKLKENLTQTFADPVNIKFDSTGRSGEITPIFSNGQTGSKYIFVLTPAR